MDPYPQPQLGRGIRGRGGRQAPVVAGRGFPVGGSPIAARLSIQQGPTAQDNSFDTFLMVSNIPALHSITVDLAHVKKVEVASKPRVLAPRPGWSTKSYCIHRRQLARVSTQIMHTVLPKYFELQIIYNNSAHINPRHAFTHFQIAIAGKLLAKIV